MKFAPMTLAASFVILPAAFAPSFAESAVSEGSFDWIFFAIVGIPFVLALVSLFNPNLMEGVVRDRHSPRAWDSGRDSIREQPGRTPPP